MSDVNTLLSHVFFGTCRPTATNNALLVDGIMVREGTLQVSPPFTELLQISLNTGAAVKLFEHSFELRVPYAIALACRLRVKYRWVVNAAGSVGLPSDVTGRWSVLVSKRNTLGVSLRLHSLRLKPSVLLGTWVMVLRDCRMKMTTSVLTSPVMPWQRARLSGSLCLSTLFSRMRL